MSARTWTLEQRQRQSEAIKRWKPWEQSCGPKSPEGKATVSRNAFTGGHLAQLRQVISELNQAMRGQKKCLGPYTESQYPQKGGYPLTMKPVKVNRQHRDPLATKGENL